MAENSPIEWTNHTWSPWEGCTKVSPGCDHCYAEGMNRWLRKGANWGPGAPRRVYSDEHWLKPLRWNAGAQALTDVLGPGERVKVFPSVCDPFDNAAPDSLRMRFAALILGTPNLTWLLLTKRIGNAAAMLTEMFPSGTPDNVWLGATVVNQEEADRDIPKLLVTQARVRFLSMEPLLGPVDLRLVAVPEAQDQLRRPWDSEPSKFNALQLHDEDRFHQPPAAVDWVIVGGESGPGARPMSIQWARSLRDQCSAAGVSFLFKQWGEWAPAGSKPSETPGRFAFGDYEHAPAHFVVTDRYPRSFTRFGARCVLERIGKKTAGRLLDGITHDGFPGASA